MGFKDEIKRRRTFAIVSHPDAGKTTLTEKLLLFGGAIQVAGAVKSNKIKKTATSDFMEIEKQRGISVATSVMGFDYREKKINILDTPGHKDFAEDTYRTLSAVDSVIIVIDVAKGVEEQTEKLCEVARMRNTPIMVFINKLDRMGKDGFELLDEVEQKLNIKVRPLSWPIGMGPGFKGVYNIYQQDLNLFSPHGKQEVHDVISVKDVNDPVLDKHVGDTASAKLREEIELIEAVYPEFNVQDYLKGDISPVFFGSAINNFGVKELLDCFVDIAPPPVSRETEERVVEPTEDVFTGFCFKIHANIDPNHRNRIAFIRICSGKFTRGKQYHHVRLNKVLRISSPTEFMAEKREIVDEAYPGDIIGIPDSGNFKIGDAVTEGEELHFKGIPSFSPEIFKYVDNADPMKSKQLAKGLDQLTDEGVAQLFTSQWSGRKILGTVGPLQFDVIQHRLQHEYGASCRYSPVNLYKACWIDSEDKGELKRFIERKQDYVTVDKDEKPVFLAESAWALQMAEEQYPKVKFHTTSEYK